MLELVLTIFLKKKIKLSDWKWLKTYFPNSLMNSTFFQVFLQTNFLNRRYGKIAIMALISVTYRLISLAYSILTIWFNQLISFNVLYISIKNRLHFSTIQSHVCCREVEVSQIKFFVAQSVMNPLLKVLVVQKTEMKTESRNLEPIFSCWKQLPLKRQMNLGGKVYLGSCAY